MAKMAMQVGTERSGVRIPPDTLFKVNSIIQQFIMTINNHDGWMLKVFYFWNSGQESGTIGNRGLRT